MNFSLYKVSLKSYFIDILFYLSGAITILFSGIRFFAGTRFFTQGIGSTDLSLFFESIAVISVLTVPVLVFRLRRFITDDSLPFDSADRIFQLSLSALTAYGIPVLLTAFVPVCVSFWGDIDFGQIFVSYTGLFIFALCGILVSFVVFSNKKVNGALSVFIAVLVLEAVNYIHLVPAYFDLNQVLVRVLRKISFACHYQVFSRGVIDLRMFVYFAGCISILIMICVYIECKRTGRKISKTNGCLFAGGVLFLIAAADNCYFTIDFSKDNQFSVSSFSQSILSKAENPLRVTYYRSPELSDYFPQSSSVTDYLETYCSSNPQISLSVENADIEKLSRLGIYSQQVQNNKGSRTEILNLYSAIVLEYEDRESIIPFSVNTQSLEFDLTRCINSLLNETENRVFLLSGNDLDFSNRNSYASVWLEQRGFSVSVISPWEVISTVSNISSNDSLVITGSSNISSDQAYAIEQAIKRGVKTFICTSPYSTAIDGDFSVTRNTNDCLIPVLNSLGFAFDHSLIHDIACYPMELTDSQMQGGQTLVRNYPLWLNILPQEGYKNSLYAFWASPVSCYKNAKGLIFSTAYSWSVAEDSSSGIPFITNPFTIPSTALEADYEKLGPFAIAAVLEENDVNVTVVSDQYFLNNLVKDQFINLDFLAGRLYSMKGQEEFAWLMAKSIPNKTLYKVRDENHFNRLHQITLLFSLGLSPFILLIVMVLVFYKRKVKAR